MANPIVPFVSSLDAKASSMWLSALRAVQTDFAVAPVDSMTDIERDEARVAIVANPSPEALSALPNLRWVQSLWAGVERLLIEFDRTDVEVVRLTDPRLAVTMAEAALTWTLYLHRDGPRYLQQQRARQWRQHDLPRAEERRVGVLGIGHLGRAAALRLKANGFDVHGWSRSPARLDGITTHTGAAGLEGILRRCEIFVVLLPLTPQTRGLLNAQRLAWMPQGASIINFARGAIIDDTALMTALNGGAMSHAVLDVFAAEPLPRAHPYWTHPCVTVLPHVAAPTDRASASAIVGQNLARFFRSGQIPTAVGRERGY